MAEFHPVVWMFDDDFEKIAYNYFKRDAIVETSTGNYADREADLSTEYVSWNHSLDEVFNSLFKHDIAITAFREYDHSPYSCFRHAIERTPGKYIIEKLEGKIPMVYALCGKKQG